MGARRACVCLGVRVEASVLRAQEGILGAGVAVVRALRGGAAAGAGGGGRGGTGGRPAGGE